MIPKTEDELFTLISSRITAQVQAGCKLITGRYGHVILDAEGRFTLAAGECGCAITLCVLGDKKPPGARYLAFENQDIAFFSLTGLSTFLFIQGFDRPDLYHSHTDPTLRFGARVHRWAFHEGYLAE